MAKKSSVYDFLYVDTDRISSLISQLDEMGVLEDISEMHSKASTTGGELSGEANTGVISGKALAGKSIDYGKQHQRNFNARFALPISFLNLLAENELIKEKPDEWGVGNIGLFRGVFTIADMTRLLPALINSNPDDPDIKLAGMILKEMPPTAQGIVLKGVTKVWSVFEESNWVTHTTALALSHGAKLDGQWAILGIVDAKPVSSRASVRADIFSETMAAMVEFSEVMKQSMGRPDNCFGFTPLLLFRQVK